MVELQDLTKELWIGQGVLVNRGEQPYNDMDLAFKEYRFKEDPQFRRSVLERMRESRLRQGLPQFSYNDACLSLNIALINAGEIQSFEAELDIQIKVPIYEGPHSLRENHLRLIVGAEMIKEGTAQYRLKMYPKLVTAQGKIPVACDQNPELTRSLSEPFELMYGVLQDMGYLAKE